MDQNLKPDINSFAQAIIQHEGVTGNQTPFRITDPSMAKWVSMFDNTNPIALDPVAKKSKGTENFLYTTKPEDVLPAVVEQFKLYASRNPNMTIGEAVNVFDQTGAKGKLDFLAQKGFTKDTPLADLISLEPQAPLGPTLAVEAPMKRPKSGRLV